MSVGPDVVTFSLLIHHHFLHYVQHCRFNVEPWPVSCLPPSKVTKIFT